MVHTVNRAGEEEGDPRHDDVSVGPSTTFQQLPPMEGPQDCLQEVAARDTTALSFLFLSVRIRVLKCFVISSMCQADLVPHGCRALKKKPPVTVLMFNG